MVRKGEVIHHYDDKAKLDRARLSSLIESAFDKTLLPNWFDDLVLRVGYVSQTYRAAAIVAEVDDFSYLDKFAIHESARGEGFARTVWDHMVRDFPTIFWRSRSDNSFNAFYAKEADGLTRQGQWTIFWKGEEDFDVIARAVKRLSEIPASFQEDSSDV
jgi:acetylglutamate kinase